MLWARRLVSPEEADLKEECTCKKRRDGHEQKNVKAEDACTEELKKVPVRASDAGSMKPVRQEQHAAGSSRDGEEKKTQAQLIRGRQFPGNKARAGTGLRTSSSPHPRHGSPCLEA